MFSQRSLALAIIVLLFLALAAGCAHTPREEVAATADAANAELLPAEDDDPLFNAVAGEFALQQGDLEAAARYLTRAAELQDDVAMAERATRVAIAAGQWSDARRALDRWTRLDQDALAAHQASATLALRDEDIEAATASLQFMLQDAREQGWMLATQVLGHAVDVEQAGRVLLTLVERRQIPLQANAHVVFSQLAQRLDLDVTALELADAALEAFPDDGEVWLWSAQLRFQSGDVKGSEALFRRGIEALPDNTPLRMGYASLLGETDGAAAAARFLAEGPQDDRVRQSRAAYAARADDEALLKEVYEEFRGAADTATPGGLMLLGQMAELLERHADALDWYANVPQEATEYPESRLRTAIVQDRLQRVDAALSTLRDIQADTESEADLVDAVLLESEILENAGRAEESLAALSRGLGLAPDDPRLVYARALQLERMDRVAEAVEAFRRMLEANPDDPTALNALGYTLADRTDQLEEAHALIERALAQVPDEPAYIDSMGWVLYRMGHLDEALDYLQRAFELMPDAEVAAHLGEVLWMLDRRDEARGVWQRGREIDADHRTLRATLERLQP